MATLLTDLRNPSSTVRTQVDNDPTITATQRTSIDSLPGFIDATVAQIPVLQNQAGSDNITPLYLKAKQLICCTLVNILQQVWLALTICGAPPPAVPDRAKAQSLCQGCWEGQGAPSWMKGFILPLAHVGQSDCNMRQPFSIKARTIQGKSFMRLVYREVPQGLMGSCGMVLLLGLHLAAHSAELL